MPTSFDSKQINVNGNIISFADVKENPAQFIQSMHSIIRASTLVKRDSETDEQYLKRIFSNAFYSKHLGIRNGASTRVASQNVDPAIYTKCANAILNTLGIDIIRRSSKSSNIVFKSTGNDYTINNSDLDNLMHVVNSNSKYERTNVNIRFGVEFEFIGYNQTRRLQEFNDAMIDLVGRSHYNEELRYRHNDGTTWMLGTDSSLSAKERGYRGYELTTPILSLDNSNDLNTLKRVIELIYIHLDGHPDKSCGTHVHMSFDVPKATLDLCKRFAKIYRDSEESLYDKLVPNHRRKNNCRYCRSTDPENLSSRFCKLNMCNVAFNTDKLHLEFRQLNGTLDYDKVIAWVKLQKMFVEITMSSINKDLSEIKNGLEFEKTICDDTFSTTDVETFLVMSKIAV